MIHNLRLVLQAVFLLVVWLCVILGGVWILWNVWLCIWYVFSPNSHNFFVNPTYLGFATICFALGFIGRAVYEKYYHD
jgi:hypothetical protein